MTNEEAIKFGKEQLEIFGEDSRMSEFIRLAIEAFEENTALNLLIDWAIQCDFGFDNFPEEYEKYKEDIKELGYKEGMIYIAKKESRGDV